MPRCNGGDRGCDIIPTRKRADFRMVIRCETCYRTCRMGKGLDKSRQMGGASKEVKCASSAEPRAWTRDELDRARTWVGKLQRRIAKAQREKKYNKVKALQHLLVTSRAAKMLAVARVGELLPICVLQGGVQQDRPHTHEPTHEVGLSQASEEKEVLD